MSTPEQVLLNEIKIGDIQKLRELEKTNTRARASYIQRESRALLAGPPLPFLRYTVERHLGE